MATSPSTQIRLHPMVHGEGESRKNRGDQQGWRVLQGASLCYCSGPMALGSTLYKFTIELADVDRAVYETLELRVAQHPSEGLDRVTVRVLARCLAHEESLEFGRGLSNVEDPALWSRDGAGQVDLWVDVGAPSAERLHRASKASGRVVVVSHKSTAGLRKEWLSRPIHQADAISVVLIPSSFVDALTAQTTRQNHWVLTVTEGYLSVGVGDTTLDTQLAYETVQSLMSG